MDRAMRIPTASVLLSVKPDADAAQIAPGFANLAGSRDNALALVHALHEGAAVKLVMPQPGSAAEVAAFHPPTGAMTWKDVKMALMLARDALVRYGIIHPSARQLQSALVGGVAAAPNGRLITFRGVLCMRAEGMNWGRIAAERFLRPEVGNRQAPTMPPEMVRA